MGTLRPVFAIMVAQWERQMDHSKSYSSWLLEVVSNLFLKNTHHYGARGTQYDFRN